MDPDIPFTTAFDGEADKADRYEAAVTLIAWLYAGGFTPSGWGGTRSDLLTQLKTIRDNNRPTRTRRT